MVLGYSSGKDAHRQLIGGVLRTGKRESHCVNYYSMLGDLSQNMGDYGRILNVLNCELPNNMSLTCGSVFTNLCRQPSFSGFERHHCTKICRAPIPRTFGYKDSLKHRLIQHYSLIKGCVPIALFASMM